MTVLDFEERRQRDRLQDELALSIERARRRADFRRHLIELVAIAAAGLALIGLVAAYGAIER